MDHATIAEQELVERYVRGLLPPEEEAAFEEHFLDCARCQDDLAMERGLGRGVRAVAAEDAARALAASGLLAWLTRQGRLARMGAALAALALVLLPALWLASRNRQLERTAEALRRDLAGEQEGSAARQRELDASEGRHAAERAALEERIAQAEARPTPGLAQALEIPVFLLATVRGGSEPAEVPSSQAARPLALAVDVGAGVAYSSYTLTVRDAAGKVLLRRAGLQPNALEVLMLTFPARFFSAGEYRVEVSGVEPGGAEQEVGRYALRVAAGP